MKKGRGRKRREHVSKERETTARGVARRKSHKEVTSPQFRAEKKWFRKVEKGEGAGKVFSKGGYLSCSRRYRSNRTRRREEAGELRGRDSREKRPIQKGRGGFSQIISIREITAEGTKEEKTYL